MITRTDRASNLVGFVMIISDWRGGKTSLKFKESFRDELKLMTLSI